MSCSLTCFRKLIQYHLLVSSYSEHLVYFYYLQIDYACVLFDFLLHKCRETNCLRWLLRHGSHDTDVSECLCQYCHDFRAGQP